jgi:hypothetical protein
MEIITDGWPDPGKEQVLLDEITCKYIQEADCTENQDEPQEIILSSRDGGGGKFINIQTKSWSITGDDFEKEIIPLLSDFKHRMDDLFSNSGCSREEILETSNS